MNIERSFQKASTSFPLPARTIFQRRGVGTTAHILQRRELISTSIFIEQPTLIVVIRGRKRLRWAGKDCVVEAGEAVAITGGQTFDVINRPASDGVYEAEWLVCAAEIATSSAAGSEGCKLIQDVLVIKPFEPAFRESFERAKEAVAAEGAIPDVVAEARIREICAWIRTHGGYFGTPDGATLAQKLRTLFGGDPRNEWKAPQVAVQLGMSEATMRRRLADESASFYDLLSDVRMSHALTLLQVTDLHVIQVAYEVGYKSLSRFALRFRRRFGFAPSEVRQSSSQI